MTSPETELLREELRRAETRLRTLREANAALERKLLRPTALRRAALASGFAALVTATLAYVGAAKLGDARAARERDLADNVHAQHVAEERIIADACSASFEKTTKAVEHCQAEREALRQRARERHPTDTRGNLECTCQRGDPLCSCL